MSSWEEAVRHLFNKHPRAMSAETVIRAIKSAPETPTNLPAVGSESRTFAETQLLLDGVTNDTQSEMSPITHTADLITRAQYRAEGRISERESIRSQLKALPSEALFYSANILKLLELD